ncbi:MAG TPA: twin-arginine translocation signal domain-containing protein [Sulfuricella sp.]|nr:twin-arginine translocation signal domain-containing protein [Sulfuricella sp.]
MDRRHFIKFCGVTAALAGFQSGYPGLSAAELKEYNRVKLVDGKGQPIKAKNLTTKDAYIFNYPFMSTPCFLINLPTKPPGGDKLVGSNGEYTWEGGTGADGTVIAFTAICSHQLSYPTRDTSPISYYATEKSEDAGRSGVIVCCEHDRVYDPAQGGKMIATNKKATQPMAAIRLEYDPATDELYAKGVYGTERFNDFFKAYKRELLEQYGPGVAKQEVADTTVVTLMSEFSATRDKC